MAQSLKSCFAFWNPQYRRRLVLLLALGLVSAWLVNAQNTLMGLFPHSLASGNPSERHAIAHAASEEGAWPSPEDGVVAPSPLRRLSDSLKSASFRTVLCLFILVCLAMAAGDFAQRYWAGRLKDRSEDDAEAVILSHLLRKDEAFFSFPAGHDQPVRTLGPGDLMGEYGMFVENVRTAAVRAQSDAALLSLDYNHFRAFLLHCPQATLALLQTAVGRLVEAERRANARG